MALEFAKAELGRALNEERRLRALPRRVQKMSIDDWWALMGGVTLMAILIGVAAVVGALAYGFRSMP